MNHGLGIILPLNGKFALPRATKRGMLLINNNIKATPLLCVKGGVIRVKYHPAFLLNKHSTYSLVRLSVFHTLNSICVAARSTSRNRGNFIARRSLLHSIRFSHVSAYNPGPVVRTITHCTGTRNLIYRISLRGVVTYNIKTYLYYIRGAGRKRIYMYGRKPMFGMSELL